MGRIITIDNRRSQFSVRCQCNFDYSSYRIARFVCMVKLSCLVKKRNMFKIFCNYIHYTIFLYIHFLIYIYILYIFIYFYIFFIYLYIFIYFLQRYIYVYLRRKIYARKAKERIFSSSLSVVEIYAIYETFSLSFSWNRARRIVRSEVYNWIAVST